MTHSNALRRLRMLYSFNVVVAWVKPIKNRFEYIARFMLALPTSFNRPPMQAIMQLKRLKHFIFRPQWKFYFEFGREIQSHTRVHFGHCNGGKPTCKRCDCNSKSHREILRCRHS